MAQAALLSDEDVGLPPPAQPVAARRGARGVVPMPPPRPTFPGDDASSALPPAAPADVTIHGSGYQPPPAAQSSGSDQSGAAPATAPAAPQLLSDEDVGIAPSAANAGLLTNTGNEGLLSGLAKGAATAAIQGVADVPGTPGNMQSVGDYLVDRVRSWVTGKSVAEIQAANALFNEEVKANDADIAKQVGGQPDPGVRAPTGDEIAKLVLDKTGEYVPDSGWGRAGMAAERVGVGSALLPGGGVIGAPSKIAALKAAAAAASAGAAGQAVGENTGDPLLGMIAGAAAPIVPASAWASASRVARPIAANVMPGVRKTMAGEDLVHSAQEPAVAQQTLAQPDANAIPGSNPTVGQLTGDIGLLAREKAARNSSPEAAVPFTQRYQEQNTAQRAAVGALAPDDAEVIDAPRLYRQQLAEETEAQRGALQGLAPDDADVMAPVRRAERRGRSIEKKTQGALDTATEAAQAERARLGPMADAGEVGQQLRGQLQAGKRGAQIDKGLKYSAVPNAELQTSALRENAAKIAADVDEFGTPMGAEEQDVFKIAGRLPDTFPYKRLQAFNTYVTETMKRERRANGESAAWRRLSLLKGQVEDAMETAQPAAARGELSPAQAKGTRIEEEWDAGAPANRQSDAAGVAGGAGTVTRQAPRGRASPKAGAPGASRQAAGPSGEAAGAPGVPGEALPGPAAKAPNEIITGAALKARHADASGAIDMGQVADAVADQVKEALAAGRPVTYVVEGKRVPITSVVRGMMTDAKGQRWGVLGLLSPNKMHGETQIEIGAVPSAERPAEALPGPAAKDPWVDHRAAIADQVRKDLLAASRGNEVLNGTRAAAIAEHYVRRAERAPASAPVAERNPFMSYARERGIPGQLDVTPDNLRFGADLNRPEAEPAAAPAPAPKAPPRKAVKGDFSPLTPQRKEPTSDFAVSRQAATDAAREYGRTYKEGPVADVLATQGFADNYTLPASAVPARAWVKGDTGGDRIRAFMKAANNSPYAVEAIRDYALNDLRAPGNMLPVGTLKVEAFKKWQADYAPALKALDEFSPGFSDEFKTAADATDVMLKAGVKHREKTEEFEESEAARLVGVKDQEQVRKTLGSILTADDARNRMNDLLTGMRQSKPAMGGLRRGVADWLIGKATKPAKEGVPETLSGLALGQAVAKGDPALRLLFGDQGVSTMRGVAGAVLQSEGWAKAAGKLLGRTDPSEVQRDVMGILRAVDGPTRLAKLTEAAKNNPGALGGLQRAGIDGMMEEFSNQAENGTSGERMFSGNKFGAFVDRHESALRILYGDKAVADLKADVADMRRTNRSFNANRTPGGSDTAQNISGALHKISSAAEHGGTLMGALMTGAILGHEHGGITGAVLGAGGTALPFLVHTLRAAGFRKVDELVRAALLDPELARALMARVSPHNPKGWERVQLAASRAIRRGLLTAPQDVRQQQKQ